MDYQDNNWLNTERNILYSFFHALKIFLKLFVFFVAYNLFIQLCYNEFTYSMT